MLQLLTEYLLLHKRVSIPHVGSFTIEQSPAQVAFADRLIHPPAYRINYKEEVHIEKPLICFITSSSKIDESAAHEQLEYFGQRWKAKIKQEPFALSGFGTLEYVADQIVFHPGSITTLQQAASAQKIIRDNVQHNVLQGEQYLQSGIETQHIPLSKREAGRHIVITGWVILLVAVLFAAYRFYQKGYSVSAAGNQSPVAAAPAPQTYK